MPDVAIPFAHRKFARLRRRSLPIILGVAALSGGLALVACSQKSQSLADYIAAICASHFRDASREEAPFLADNVSAGRGKFPDAKQRQAMIAFFDSL